VKGVPDPPPPLSQAEKNNIKTGTQINFLRFIGSSFSDRNEVLELEQITLTVSYWRNHTIAENWGQRFTLLIRLDKAG
jgi:hypothetical protein